MFVEVTHCTDGTQIEVLRKGTNTFLKVREQNANSLLDIGFDTESTFKLLEINPGSTFNGLYFKDIVGHFMHTKVFAQILALKMCNQVAMLSLKDFFTVPANIPFELTNRGPKPLLVFLKISS
jgi:hypothetical protein